MRSSGKLEWVDAGRGFAAVAVILSHSGLSPLLGTYGVAFFFVLSGFIILYKHERDIGCAGTAPHFVWRRIARVFPTYYLVLPIALLISQLRPPPYRDVLSPSIIAQELFLLPGQQPILGPAWTLRYEIFFYGIFVTLLLNRRLGIAAMLMWLAALLWHFFAVGMWTTAVWTAPEIYLHHLNLYFFVGMGLAIAERGGRTLAYSFACAGTGLALLLLQAVIRTDDPRLVAAALLFVFGAIVGGLVWLSKRVATPSFFVALGGASYALYLIQRPLLEVFNSLDKRTGYHIGSHLYVAVAVKLLVTLGPAFVIYYWYDKPTTQRLNRRRSVLGIDVRRPSERRGEAIAGTADVRGERRRQIDDAGEAQSSGAGVVRGGGRRL